MNNDVGQTAGRRDLRAEESAAELDAALPRESAMTHSTGSYLLADQPTELDRLQLQSRVWEPAGRELLAQLPSGSGLAALDVGCGVMGWLRVLSEWVGPQGRVVGTDIADKMLGGARSFVEAERLGNVTLMQDDLFASKLQPGSFDLLHARFQIAPLGRAPEQVTAYRRLLKPGGWMVLEDPDMASWRVNPDAPAVRRLIELIEAGFRAAGGDFNSGRELPSLFRRLVAEPRLNVHVVALSPGHPYLRLPLQFAASLRPRLTALIAEAELDVLVHQAESELQRPGIWGTTFMLIQAYASLPA